MAGRNCLEAISCSKEEGEEYGWKKYIPPGMGFFPTDEELITHYLLPKSLNLKLHSGIISDLDIYNYEPHQLQDFAFDHGDGRMYFFSPLKMKNKDGSGTRGDRVIAGHKGCWKASQKRDIVLGSKNENIGTKQSLVYHSAKRGKTSWLMTEYRFLDESQYDKGSHKLALCVIYYYNHKKGEASSRKYDGEDPNFTIDEFPNTDYIKSSRIKRQRKSSSIITTPNSECPSDIGCYPPPVCATGSTELDCLTSTKVNKETMTDAQFYEILSHIFY